ncbi:MAG: carbamoyltransferase N-terminal domain-containing protein, partial [Solirubrobacteraceae bacterium]
MILGVNAPPTGWHDPAACLVDADGTLLAFCEEERLSRAKHAERSGPRMAVAHCLERAGAAFADVELVAVGWDVPHAARMYGVEWRLEDTPDWLARYLGWTCSWRDMPEVRFVGHHLAHATIAFHASDFDEAAVLVVDGNGDDEAISIYRADRDRPLVRTRVWPRSHSLGYLYDAACRFVGFGPLQAGKLMGLSAYGRAAAVEPWELLPGGEPAVPDGVDAGDGFNRYLHAWTAQIDRLAGGRRVARERRELHRDPLAVQVAVSAQDAVERTMLRLAALARELAGTENLCLAGGVALNCKANGLLSGPVYAPPAPHDAGTALGAAWH